MKSFAELLSTLGRDLDAKTIGLTEAAQAVARHVCAALRCSRASLWTLAGEPGAQRLRRLGGYDSRIDELLGEADAVAATGLPACVVALGQSATFVSDDVAADPRLAHLRHEGLLPEDARAVLLATLGDNGRVTGLIFCEQLGQPRRWQPAEATQLKRFADEISIRRARRRRREAESQALARALVAPPEGLARHRAEEE